MDSYLFLKTLHLVGVVIFVGNITVTAWWKARADRTRDPRIVAFAQRQVTLTVWIFTLSGVVLVAVGGIGKARLREIPMTTPWLAARWWGVFGSIATLLPLVNIAVMVLKFE